MQNNTLPAGHLTTALNAGYLLEDILPLIPINGPLDPGGTYQDGTPRPALTPEEVAMGKQPGKFIRYGAGGYWVRRKAWNSTSITQDEIAIHDGARCNLGFKTGPRVVALDVDISDPVVMNTFRPVMETLLEGAIRVGKHPKCLWLFRVVGKPIKRRQIALSNGHLIEVLGTTSTGNPSQCVALGMHPSDVPYTWNGDGSLPRYEDLPTVDQATMDRIVTASLTVAKACGLAVIQSEMVEGGNPETSAQGLSVTPDLAELVMAELPNQNLGWDAWKATGIALWNAVGADAGWPIWDAWSRKATAKYDENTTEQTWRRGMWPNNRSSGFGSLVHKLRRSHGGVLPDHVRGAFAQRKLCDAIDSGLIPEHPVLPPEMLMMSRAATDPAYGLMIRELRKVDGEYFQFVNVEVVTAIWDRSFHTADGKYRFLNAIGDPPVATPAERFAAALPMHFGILMNWEAAYQHALMHLPVAEGVDRDQAANDHVNSIYGKLRGKLMLTIETTRQRNTIDARVNMFIPEATIEVGHDVVRYEVVHKSFPEGPVRDALVADYKEHFPQLDQFLNLLVAARFARDRRKAFMWLRAVSNWGKGFLIKVLADLGLVVEMKEAMLAKIMDGQPAPLAEGDFLRAWVVVFDEFKSLKGDLKSINNTIPLSPKNRMRVTVDVFLKLFTSAEEVPALTGRGHGGVETQFAMRFNHWHFKSGDIDQRPVYQADTVAYMDSVKNYVARELNGRVAAYRELGEADAARQAAKFLAEFHNANTIANQYEMIGTGIGEIAETIMDACRKFCAIRIVKSIMSERDRFDQMSQAGVPVELVKLMDQHVRLVYVNNEPVVAVVKPSAFIDGAVRIVAGRASASLSYKVEEIAEQMEDRSFAPNYKGHGVPPIRCMRADVLPAFTMSGQKRFLAFKYSG
ncbi:hypothetical protein [Shimia thalassica]|uniref:hypothetical protein n=1 Tax=Shimia thalassica TaxID=1715693 RepID=UPI002737524F|nr:hypothetical protein [Shimia thalassica]MDP2518830.1 hypothetical protein [Shimia thalassica]